MKNIYQRVDLVFEKVNDEILVIDHRRGNLITLNTTASFLWENLAKPISLSELALRYAKKFGNDKINDMTLGIKKLVRAEVVTTKSK